MIAGLLCLTGLTIPAAVAKPLPPDSTTILFGFSYNYDTYVWSDSIIFRRSLGTRSTWGLQGGLSATQIDAADDLERRQRFLMGRVYFDHQLSSRWSIGFSARQRRHRLEELADRHFVFSDALVKARYTLGAGSWFQQQAGVSSAGRAAGQFSTDDRGFTSETELQLESNQFLNRLWRLSGSVDIHDLRNVPLVETRWHGLTQGSFFWGDTLAVDLADHYRQARYYPNTNEYKTIAEQHYHQGHFLTTLNGTWQQMIGWELRTHYTWHREEYEFVNQSNNGIALLPSGLRQMSAGYRLRLSTAGRYPYGVQASYAFSKAEDDFGADVKDQDAKTGELQLSGYLRVTHADSVGAKVLWKVVSFFVPPDSAFFTDRDLATRLTELSWFHTFNQTWRAGVIFTYRGLQQVFLSGQWSANNNRNNIYLLEPQVRWQPLPGWEINQTYRIQANYLSYNIEKGEPQPERSTLYRRGESESLVRFTPLARLTNELRYTYRQEDFGPLIWREKWNQQVSWDRQSHVIGARWHVGLGRGWRVTPGASYEEKRSFNHQTVDEETIRVPGTTFVRRVMELTIRWQPARGRDDLFVSWSRRLQRSSQRPKDIADWVQITYRRNW